jgi:murein DD-endopeptidase MepM/ murein hydrolase activator NlpD
MTKPLPSRLRLAVLAGGAIMALAACEPDGTFDPDLRNFGRIGFDTTAAARTATANRPAPDARGIISYPNYQVAVARKGDRVADVANRIGVDAGALARYNAVSPDAVLNKGEVLALPNRVAEPTGAATNPGAIQSDKIDITSLASSAIDRAEATQPATPVSAPKPTGPEPTRHKVARGETAYSIARYYDVSVRSLADWNGLPADLAVREGQYLLIPVAAAKAPARASDPVTEPGQGSQTPTPPSAAKPLPAETPPKASAPVDTSAAPDLGSSRTAASGNSKFAMPVTGAIIRPYKKGKNDGVDIAAAPGTAVKAAEAGTVAAITKNTEQVPIVVLRHDGGLLTVYANLDGVTVTKGASVKRGQTIAKVRAGEPSFLHFEVRQGFESVDPMPYLQ